MFESGFPDTSGREEGLTGGLAPGEPRTGVSERIVLTHCSDTRPYCDWWGNGALACFEKSLGGS
jgi:hypothetical protein